MLLSTMTIYEDPGDDVIGDYVVRVASRFISPQWGSIRIRPPTHPHVRPVGRTCR